MSGKTTPGRTAAPAKVGSTAARSRTRPAARAGSAVQRLQRRLGNHGTLQLLRMAQASARSERPVPAAQAALTVGPADDRYEREAETAAARVAAGESAQPALRLPLPSPAEEGGFGAQPVRRMCAECAEAASRQPEDDAEPSDETDAEQPTAEPILRRLQDDPDEKGRPEEPGQDAEVMTARRRCAHCRQEAAIRATHSEGRRLHRMCADCAAKAMREERPEAARERLDPARAEAAMARSGRGDALPPALAARMEKGLGADFSAVRVHTGTAAAEAAEAIDARAFARGPDIFLGRGESVSDVRLMAHELTHTIQQGAATSGTPGEAAAAGPTAARAQRAPKDGEDDAAASVPDDAAASVPDDAAAPAPDEATGPGREASLLAAALGTTVSVTRDGLEIVVPDVCPLEAIVYELALDEYSQIFPIALAGTPIAPGLVLTGSVGLAATFAPSLRLELVRACFTGVRIVVDPLSGNLSITGALTADANAVLEAEARVGLRGEIELIAIVPVGGVPVPITIPLVGLEGGIAGLARGIGSGHLTLESTTSRTASAIALRQSGQLDLDLAADMYLGAYAQLDILGRNFCRIYWQPYEWHGAVGGTTLVEAGLTVPLLGRPSVTAEITQPAFEEIPYADVALALERDGFSDACQIIDDACAYLRENNLLPSQNGGVWNWSGTPDSYGPGPRLPGPLDVYQRDPGIPSGSTCRGACGPNCDTCTASEHYDHVDPLTGITWLYTNFEDCNSHEACRQHDAAFDWAAAVHGEIGRGAEFMPWHMRANIECACNYPAGNCAAWIAGLPPYDMKMYFADSAEQISSGDLQLEARLEQYLALGDPEEIVAVLAEAPQEERAFLAANPDALARLEAAVGLALWPTARRIFAGAASAAVPSLDEATWFLADRAIRRRDQARALSVVLSHLVARGFVIPSLAGWSYVDRADRGEGITRFTLVEDPTTRTRRAQAPVAVEIYTPAYRDVGWLFSTIMHEYVHVQQVLAGYAAGEFEGGEQGEEFVARDEVESYLWEIEHALGTGLINNSGQMRELEKRLSDHFDAMTPALQRQYRDRYDAARARVRDVRSGRRIVSVEEARRIVQSSSHEIEVLLRQRRPDNAAEINAQIELIRRRRAQALIEVALVDNPAVQVERPGDPGIYKVATLDAEGRVRYLHGGIQVAWHLAPASTSAYTLGEELGASGEMAIAGTAVQGRVQPFPPDIDFDEHIHVVANTREDAGRRAAERIIERIRAVSGGPVPGRQDIEFRHLVTYFGGGGSRMMTLSQVLAPNAAATLGGHIARLNGGNINSFWRGFIVDRSGERRFTDVTRVIYVTAKKPDGTDLLVPAGSADLNLAFLEDPGVIPATSAGAFAYAMCAAAVTQMRAGKWLKAAKRAYNYFSTIGDLEGMAALEPAFRTAEADVERYASVLEAIQRTLPTTEPKTRVLLVDDARAQVERAADAIETRLPDNTPNVPAPALIGARLRTLAPRFRARDAHGNLRQDDALAAAIGLQVANVRAHVNAGVAGIVRPVVERLAPICPSPPRRRSS
jgi:hypothetical protein